MTSLARRIIEIHRRLDAAGLAHAFGGALALAWCTERARGTIDIDLNVFVGVADVDVVLHALSPSIAAKQGDRSALERDGQVRLWWDATPVDVFLNTTEFHEQAADRARWEEFAGESVPFLSCDDLAVFKACFNRTKDWADLEEMAAAKTLDIEKVVGVLAHYLGPQDERIPRLLALA